MNIEIFFFLVYRQLFTFALLNFLLKKIIIIIIIIIIILINGYSKSGINDACSFL